jgi:nucleoside-diphosphate-sugar epimerase
MILVTGATGTIGSEVVGELLAADERPRAFVRDRDKARRLLGDELVRDLFYESAKTCWDHCAKSFVREIRATQNDDFARELQAWIDAPDP